MKSKEEKISDTADLIQTEMHKSIDFIRENNSNSELSYQDMANVFLIRKIAELTEKNKELNSELKSTNEKLNHHIKNHITSYNGNIK